MKSLPSICTVHPHAHTPTPPPPPVAGGSRPSPMTTTTTSGAPTPPRFKRSPHRKKRQPRTRRVAAGETIAAGKPPHPACTAVSLQSPFGPALPRDFFEVDALDLAPRLLGKLLRRDEVVLRITEVEAYRPNDSACHGRFGITARTAPVFGSGGHAYVYLCYGLHMMLNVVADKEGVGAAVLIRSCAPGWQLFSSVEASRLISHFYSLDQERLVKLWGFPLTGPTILCTHLVLDGPEPENILVGPRVGIEYASPEHVAAPWRFAVAGTPWISAPKNTLIPR
uniref:DNA-3-methyladenine glycosylase II n=1 Tax=Oryza glumipatula TaxID=40148 RepID=A0A0D9YZ31_9ORYZ